MLIISKINHTCNKLYILHYLEVRKLISINGLGYQDIRQRLIDVHPNMLAT